MIVYKYFELRRGKKFIERLYFVERADHAIHGVFAKARKFISYFNRHSALALIQWIAYHILSWIRFAYIAVRTKAHSHPSSKKKKKSSKN